MAQAKISGLAIIVGLLLGVAGLFTLLWLDVFTIKLFFNSIGVAI